MPYLSNPDFLKVRAHIDTLADRTELHSDEEDAAAEVMMLMDKAIGAVADPGLREEAHDKYGSDDIEIDDEGVGTSPADGGIWVQAWVWIERADEDEEDTGTDIVVDH